jgi:hypothetical protein
MSLPSKPVVENLVEYDFNEPPAILPNTESDYYSVSNAQLMSFAADNTDFRATGFTFCQILDGSLFDGLGNDF